MVDDFRMRDLPTVRIVDPNKPGDYLNIDMLDYDESVHELWPEQSDDAVEAAQAVVDGRYVDSYELEDERPSHVGPQNNLGGYSPGGKT